MSLLADVDSCLWIGVRVCFAPTGVGLICHGSLPKSGSFGAVVLCLVANGSDTADLAVRAKTTSTMCCSHSMRVNCRLCVSPVL